MDEKTRYWLNIAGIVLVVILIVTFVVCISWIEYKDLNCPGSRHSSSNECGFGRGAVYARGIVESGDDLAMLLNRIEYSSEVLQRTLYWKRSVLLGLVSTILVWAFAVRRMPNLLDFLLTWLLITVTALTFFSFYEFHHLMPPYDNIHKATQAIRDKLGIVG